MELILGDRRSDRRYDVEMQLRYRILNSAHHAEGTGISLNMSRGGVLFQADKFLPEGAAVELAIDWPIRLRGRIPLELHIMGHVVRCENNMVALRTSWHEFLRVGVAGSQEVPVEEESALVM